ncbi:MAG: 3-oxoacyl-ACP reductase FabG [Myxococcota bacterium]
MQFDFRECRVIVTGGTRGIGAGVCKAFLRAGATVTATYSADHDTANGFKQSCGEDEDRLSLAQFDVSVEADVKAFFDALEEAPTIVVNNAGVRRDAILGMMKREDWERVLAVNLTGTFNMTKQAVRAMSRARYGRIINIVSPSGRLGLAGQANYAASKAGQEALSRSVAKEVARRNITVNCVSPGFVDTDLLQDLDEKTKAELLARVPLERFASVEEIASAVLFLASPEAAYITGATLEVSGGL